MGQEDGQHAYSGLGGEEGAEAPEVEDGHALPALRIRGLEVPHCGDAEVAIVLDELLQLFPVVECPPLCTRRELMRGWLHVLSTRTRTLLLTPDRKP